MTTEPTPGHPPSGERADLLAALAHARQFLRHTVRHLADADARRRTTTSQLCLGGLIKHVTAVEQGWKSFIVGGATAHPSAGEESLEAHRRQFTMGDEETLASLLDEYAQVAGRTDELVGRLPDLDDAQALPEAPWFEPGARWSARRVLLHIVAETAQHAGHADILRESLDGARSMG